MDNTVTLYTPKDIERIFSCGRKKSYEIMHIKDFPSFKIENSIYVEKDALEKWIARKKNSTIFYS